MYNSGSEYFGVFIVFFYIYFVWFLRWFYYFFFCIDEDREFYRGYVNYKFVYFISVGMEFCCWVVFIKSLGF